MQLHEYQTKRLYAQYKLPVAMGQVATSPQEAYSVAKLLGGRVVVKAQVFSAGRGRGKAGGISLAETPDQARDKAEQILGMTIDGLTVHKVLVDPAADVAHEMTVILSVDYEEGCPLISVSAKTFEPEQGKHGDPSLQASAWINPFLGLCRHQVHYLANAIRLPYEYWSTFTQICQNFYQCFAQNDAIYAELRPLAITSENKLTVIDGKMIIDQHAMFRHADLADMRDLLAEHPDERRAREAGLNYVLLEGDVACMVNGAGLAMAVMDTIADRAAGVANVQGPACFLDLSGGARADQVVAGLRIMSANPRIISVVCAIFGGVTRVDEVAQGIVAYVQQSTGRKLPIVVRMVGTQSEHGLNLLYEANLQGIFYAQTVREACDLAIRIAAQSKTTEPSV
jgi:succinyl-CoA synthetase beta subunit